MNDMGCEGRMGGWECWRGIAGIETWEGVMGEGDRGRDKTREEGRTAWRKLKWKRRDIKGANPSELGRERKRETVDLNRFVRNGKRIRVGNTNSRLKRECNVAYWQIGCGNRARWGGGKQPGSDGTPGLGLCPVFDHAHKEQLATNSGQTL